MPEPACTRSELRLLIIWRMIWSEFFVEGLSLFIVALCNTADRYIFALWFVSSIFFPRLISVAADWMSTILLQMVGPSVFLVGHFILVIVII